LRVASTCFLVYNYPERVHTSNQPDRGRGANGFNSDRVPLKSQITKLFRNRLKTSE